MRGGCEQGAQPESQLAYLRLKVCRPSAELPLTTTPMPPLVHLGSSMLPRSPRSVSPELPPAADQAVDRGHRVARVSAMRAVVLADQVSAGPLAAPGMRYQARFMALCPRGLLSA